MAIFDWGDKVLVAHRRLFERDALRFFLGTVTDYEAGIFKVKGRTYLQDPATGGIHKKNDERTKIYSVQSGAILVYHLPAEVCIESLEFTGHWGSITLRNKSGFKMDLAEQFQDMPGSKLENGSCSRPSLAAARLPMAPRYSPLPRMEPTSGA